MHTEFGLNERCLKQMVGYVLKCVREVEIKGTEKEAWPEILNLPLVGKYWKISRQIRAWTTRKWIHSIHDLKGEMWFTEVHFKQGFCKAITKQQETGSSHQQLDSEEEKLKFL